MNPVAAYGTAGLLFVGLTTLALWPFLDGPARTGVAVAAVVALPLQVALFALLRAGRDRTNYFLVAWVGGTLVRLGLIGAGVVVVVTTSLPAAPTLLGLAGFLFGLLLLESAFFRLQPVTEQGK